MSSVIDPVTTLKNKPFKRGGAYALVIAFGCVLAFSMYKSFKDKGEKPAVEEKSGSYTRSQYFPVPDDKYLKGEYTAALSEIKAPKEISLDINLVPEKQESEKHTPMLPARSDAAGSRDNPYKSEWLSRQMQSFSSGITSGRWNSQAAPQAQPAQSGSSREIEYLKSLAAGVNGTDSRTAQEKFFETAGRNSQGVHSYTRTGKSGTYTLPAGTVIPCVLVTGINTDLPGDVTAQVSENVYDWTRPDVVLIPQGSRVYGRYSSSLSYGQKRAQAAWTRLVYPDGSSLNLAGMEGTDGEGYSGLKDKYNSHLNSILLSTALTASFAGLGEMFDDENSSVYIGSSSSSVESEVAGALARMGEKLFSRNMSRSPTVVIRPGYRFNIRVNADIPFSSAWNG